MDITLNDYLNFPSLIQSRILLHSFHLVAVRLIGCFTLKSCLSIAPFAPSCRDVEQMRSIAIELDIT